MKRKSPFKKFMLALVSVILLAMMITATAFAAEDAGVTLDSGSLSGGAITFADFAGITLNGQQQTTASTWSIGDIVDSRGTGEGWNLSLNLTQLKEYDTLGSAYVPAGHVIPTGSITVDTAPTITLVDGTSSPAGTITAVAVATPLDTEVPVKLLSAEIDGGMGSYSIGDLTSTLAVRADAYAGTYKTDATVSLVSGP